MKKTLTVLVLLFVLSISAFAEGDIPLGGSKSCPPGQTCLTDGDVPIGGSLTDNGGIIHGGGRAENSITKNIFDFLISIF